MLPPRWYHKNATNILFLFSSPVSSLQHLLIDDLSIPIRFNLLLFCPLSSLAPCGAPFSPFPFSLFLFVFSSIYHPLSLTVFVFLPLCQIQLMLLLPPYKHKSFTTNPISSCIFGQINIWLHFYDTAQKKWLPEFLLKKQ